MLWHLNSKFLLQNFKKGVLKVIDVTIIIAPPVFYNILWGNNLKRCYRLITTTRKVKRKNKTRIRTSSPRYKYSPPLSLAFKFFMWLGMTQGIKTYLGYIKESHKQKTKWIADRIVMLNPHICVGLLFIRMRSSGLGWINLILPLMCLCCSI